MLNLRFNGKVLMHTNTLLCMLVTLFLLTSCGKSETTESNKPSDIVRPAKIFHVSDPSSSLIRNFPAEVEANAKSLLAFRVSGQIIKFPVKAGNTVTKGQVLAQLDPTDFQLRLDDRKARYELAQSQFTRAKSLLAKNLAPQSTYDEAKANLSVALSSYESAKVDLAYTTLRAPFAGSVAKVLVKQHENVQAKQPILMLQTRDMIDISIQIPENIISKVHKDTHYQPTVVFDSHPDSEYLVTVKEWDTQADPTTLTYKVVFSMPTPTTFNVLPGMSANVKIDLAQITDVAENRFLVPVSAVFVDEDEPLNNSQKYVWKVDATTSTVHKVAVTVGEIKDEGIEVFTGVKVGDDIVAAGVHYLTEGMKVRAWSREKGL
jgi:RND family efflux transporter MFP subunit